MFEIRIGGQSIEHWEAIWVVDLRLTITGAAHPSQYPSPFTAGCQLQVPTIIQFQTSIIVVWFRPFVKLFQIHLTIGSSITSHMSSGGVCPTKPTIESTENYTRQMHSSRLTQISWFHPANQTVTCLIVLSRSCSGQTPRSSPRLGVPSCGRFISTLAIRRSTCVVSRAQIYVLTSPISNR